MTPRSARAGFLAATLVLCLGVGFEVHALWTRSSSSVTPPSSTPVSAADALQTAFVQVAERVRPAVVNLGTVQMSRAPRRPARAGAVAVSPGIKDFLGHHV